MKQRRFIHIALISVVVLLVGVLGYFYLANTPSSITEREKLYCSPLRHEPQPPISNTQQATSSVSDNTPVGILPINNIQDWKTYQNEHYGFELKYPAFFNVTTVYPDPALLFSFHFFNPKAKGKEVFVITFFSYNYMLNESYGSGWQYQGDAKIAGYDAKKLFRPTPPPGYYIETDMTAYLIGDKNMSIVFNDNKYHQVSQIDLDTILSTFKFLK